MSSSSSAVILGPWGGSGGDAFDDGWQNGGVVKLTVYYQNIVTGFQVVYGDGTTKLHGRAQGAKAEVDLSSSSVFDISVIEGTDSVFSGDAGKKGVVGLGARASTALPSFPSGVNGTAAYRPQVLGFFGRSGDRIDCLGIYVSN